MHAKHSSAGSMRRACLVWISAGLILGGCGDARVPPADRIPPDPRVAEIVTRVADTWVGDVPPGDMAWDWGPGVLTYGLLAVAQRRGHRDWQEYVRTYARLHQEREVPIFWSDHCTPSIAAAELVLDGDTSVLPILERVVDYVMNRAPRTAQGAIRHLGLVDVDFVADVWVDSLFHWIPTLVRFTEITGNDAFRTEAVAQMIVFLDLLQDPASGLVAHAYRGTPDEQRIPSFDEGLFWARGNGWSFAALVDLIASLPPADARRSDLLERARSLEAGLRSAQDPTGLFHTVLLDASTYSETAGSALIVYGMARGVREGLFGTATAAAARLGMDGLLSVVAEGPAGRAEVTGTSLGTIPLPRAYASVPTDRQVDYGVGAWLLAASEFLGPEVRTTAR